ncbi:MAG TPA: CDP-alcohol phosphatidyltransferase family protein [Candidatus Binatia bacterium]|nr:CDP-alcohol phosphatidyltransferase family protein [Candidatus Binatia bacterium]
MRPADALGALRLVVAALFPYALGAASARWVALLLFVVAAASDYLDGIVARRGRGPTAHGAILDNVADVAFVLAGTAAGARLGLVPVAVPVAIALAVAGYALASARRGTPARSALGHAAGVANYALAGLLAGAVAWPGRPWSVVLAGASAVVVALNLGAVVARAAAISRALVPRVAGSRAR